MSILKKLVGGSDLVKSVGDTLDKVTTTDEERLAIQMEMFKAEREVNAQIRRMIVDQNLGQIELNKEEARSGKLFVAGWRPAIGWIGAIALFYQFIIYPLLLWLPIDNPPKQMEADVLYTIITGMLGIAGMRSFDKLKKTDTKGVNK
ncbi:MAG: holin family protein [Gammaproteobacteria bacterium]|nr:holin family protein [Gammaproteobacteria bacterium]